MKLNKYQPHQNRHAPYSRSVLLQDLELVALSKQSLPLESLVIWYHRLCQMHKKLVYLLLCLPQTEKIRTFKIRSVFHKSGAGWIPNSVWTIVHRAHSGILDTAYNSGLESGVFPTRWKVAQLVLLQKPGRPVGDPTSFQPLCILDNIGKNFEHPVAEWLRKHFWKKCTLSTDQYGFQAGLSMIDAAWKVKKLAASGIKKHQLGTAVSLETKNAFNSMPWMRIMNALENAKMPVFLHGLIQNYF